VGNHDPHPCYQMTPRYGGVPMGHGEPVEADGDVLVGKKSGDTVTK
jgi:hypothetical protein